MKILIVSMNSIHTNRWLEQLKDSHHQIYYFEALGGSFNKTLGWVEYQHYEWKNRLGNKQGRYFIKKNFPAINEFILQKNSAVEFEKIVKKIKPDVVHSFTLHIACVPILSVMKKYKNLKWIYSAWGNDLFYHQNISKNKMNILKTLPHIDYMFADCQRDSKLAFSLGFKGLSLGKFPTGGGYQLDYIGEKITGVDQRDGILIKGYQGKIHKGLNVIKAIEKFKKTPKITIFSTDQILIDYIHHSRKLNIEDFEIYCKNESISHKKICKMMNKHKISIGNNLSDGMPNTLLEAVCFGAFPIQTNPGGASAEIISHGENGLLIEDCENISEIYTCLETALNNNDLVKNAFEINQKLKYSIEFEHIKEKVLKKYDQIESELL